MNKNTTKRLTNNDLLQEVSEKLDRIEEHLPNGELTIIVNHVESIMDRQEKMYQDLSEMKKLLLNPDDGVVVKVNRNTEFRKDMESKEEKTFQLIEQHNELVKFKSNITKTLWIILSSIIGSIVMLWQKIFQS